MITPPGGDSFVIQKGKPERPGHAEIQTVVMKKKHFPFSFTPLSQIYPQRWKVRRNHDKLVNVMDVSTGSMGFSRPDSLSWTANQSQSHWWALPQIQWAQSSEKLPTRADQRQPCRTQQQRTSWARLYITAFPSLGWCRFQTFWKTVLWWRQCTGP